MPSGPIQNASCVGRPKILSEADMRGIYDAAVTIAESAGMRIEYPEALDLLREVGCEVVDETVRIPGRLIEEARRTVPPRVLVFNRSGDIAMELGGYNSYFGTGSDLMYTWDLDDKSLRPTRLDDVARAARLCDALPNIDFVMSCAHPHDVTARESYLRSFQAMITNTLKPVVVTAEGVDDLEIMWRIASTLRGSAESLGTKPYVIVYTEPVSPLQHGYDALAKLMFSARNRIPVAYIPAPLAGGTGPITLAGLLAQGLAEYFVGMVIHQLVSPGAPLIFGVCPLVLDLESSQASYSAIEFTVGHTAQAEIARWLDVPNWGYGGVTDSHSLDSQAGLQLAEITLLDMLAGSNLNHDVGYQGFGLCASLEQVVVVNEFISMNRRLLNGIRVDNDTLAIDAISQVGPGGEFVSHRHTRRHCREAQWRPSLTSRDSRESWEREGCPDLRERARQKARDLLASHDVAALPDTVASCAEALIVAYGDSAVVAG